MSEEEAPKTDEGTAPEEKAPEWQRKEEFAIVSNLKGVIKATMAATESEIQALHRKLKKLQYGG